MKKIALLIATTMALAACQPQPVGQAASAANSSAGGKVNPDVLQVADFKPQPVEKELHEKLMKALQSQVEKGAKIRSINTTPVDGLYEVVMNGNMIGYITEDGRHLIAGSLVSVSPEKNLTAERMAELSRINFKDLPLEAAIKTVYGDGSVKIAVFADPDCPYCKQLEQMLSKAQNLNLTVYTFMLPIDELHPEANRKARQIMCSTDPEQTWQDVMLGKKVELGALDCEDAKKVDVGIDLADRYGIRGTPTIVFENGYVQGGVMSPEQIIALAQSNNQSTDDLLNKAASVATNEVNVAPASASDVGRNANLD